MARLHTEVLLEVLVGLGFTEPHPQPVVPNQHGLLRIQPHSPGSRRRIWWVAGSNSSAVWAAELGMHLMSSTLKDDEDGRPFHVQQAAQVHAFREAWAAAGHEYEPRVSVSRSIIPIVDGQDAHFFAGDREGAEQVGVIEPGTRSIFGRSYADEPDALVEQLREDEAIAAADTLMITVPNQLGVDYLAAMLEKLINRVA